MRVESAKPRWKRGYPVRASRVMLLRKLAQSGSLLWHDRSERIFTHGASREKGGFDVK